MSPDTLFSGSEDPILQRAKKPRPNPTRLLSLDYVCKLYEDTRDYLGRSPTEADTIVFDKDKGLLEDEIWRTIQYAMAHRERGMVYPDGSYIARNLRDFKENHGYSRWKKPIPLSPEERAAKQEKKRTVLEKCNKDLLKIRKVFEDTFKYTNAYITPDTPITYVEYEPGKFRPVMTRDEERLTGRHIQNIIRRNWNALADLGGSSYPKDIGVLIKQYNYISVPDEASQELSALPLMTEKTLRKMINDTRLYTGKWPTTLTQNVWMQNENGHFERDPRHTWALIDLAIKCKWTGLHRADLSTLADGLPDYLIQNNYINRAPENPGARTALPSEIRSIQRYDR